MELMSLFLAINNPLRSLTAIGIGVVVTLLVMTAFGEDVVKKTLPIENQGEVSLIMDLKSRRRLEENPHSLVLKKPGTSDQVLWKSTAGDFLNSYAQLVDAKLTNNSCSFLLSSEVGIYFIRTQKDAAGVWKPGLPVRVLGDEQDSKAMTLGRKKMSLTSENSFRIDYYKAPSEFGIITTNGTVQWAGPKPKQ